MVLIIGIVCIVICFVAWFLYIFMAAAEWRRRSTAAAGACAATIPRRVFLTWHSKEMPPKMRENVETLCRENPDFEVFLYDDADCREFVARFFGPIVCAAYDRLVPGTYRADLWRYCILWYYGGIYLDIKVRLVGGARLRDFVDAEHFVRERDGYWAPESAIGIYNAVLICRPRNPLLWDCIQTIVKNVRGGYYGFNPLYPTGPGMMGDLYAAARRGRGAAAADGVPDFDMFHLPTLGQVVYKDKLVMEHYPEYRDEQQKDPKYKSYYALWREGKIYARAGAPPQN
jgi:hypothetical protein